MLSSVKFPSFKTILVACASFTYLCASAQTFEIDPVNRKDTINLIDYEGKKQGRWIVYGKSKPDTCYAKTSKVEEGPYADNRKKGIWTSYFCSGNIQRKITFQNGRPDGYAIFFHENGKTAEEGTWKVNKWINSYKAYYPNGQVQQEFTFNQSGKREGVQKYYYNDGKVQIEGNWANGKENGVVKEFHPDGSLKKTVDYTNGNADVANIKEYQPKTQLAEKKEEIVSAKKVTATKEESTVADVQKPTVLNGYHVLFNKDRQKTKDGTFKDNRLMDGKNYIYDKNGILKEIEIYKNGMFVGTTQAE
jgi:antitoxin component YwqK of YwqJK toxin-antitoxin module